MSSGTFVDRIDPFAKRSLKKKQKKSQGSSRYRTGGDVELTALPLLKGKTSWMKAFSKLGHFLEQDRDNALKTHTTYDFEDVEALSTISMIRSLTVFFRNAYSIPQK